MVSSSSSPAVLQSGSMGMRCMGVGEGAGVGGEAGAEGRAVRAWGRMLDVSSGAVGVGEVGVAMGLGSERGMLVPALEAKRSW